ncbi:uncharacterized protein LOC143878373 [Tasmannia lanceolata]|uniref:uncharacterized protein LOC143878373 n=1 Tax=Tasmannia lanceolata TaxID=3420 RepID=UPI0040649164
MKSSSTKISSNRRPKEASWKRLDYNRSSEERKKEIPNVLEGSDSDASNGTSNPSVLSLDPDIAVTKQESGKIIDGNQESGDINRRSQKSGEIIRGSQKSGKIIHRNQESGDKISESQESVEIIRGSQESGKIIDGNQESGDKIRGSQGSGEIICGSQKSGEIIEENQESGEKIRESQESSGSEDGKMENVEVEVVVDFLRRACFQAVSSSDLDIRSKKLLDALIKNLILELKPLGKERSGSNELLWLKMRIGLLCFFLGIIILVSALLLLDFGDGNSFPGSITPT